MYTSMVHSHSVSLNIYYCSNLFSTNNVQLSLQKKMAPESHKVENIFSYIRPSKLYNGRYHKPRKKDYLGIFNN